MINAMNSVNGLSSAAENVGGTIAAGAGLVGSAAPFSDLLKDAVGSVSHLQDEAKIAVSGLMSGNGTDIHQAMIASEKANMAFELSLAVRNKAVQAYQQVMSMQF